MFYNWKKEGYHCFDFKMEIRKAMEESLTDKPTDRHTVKRMEEDDV